MATTVCRRGGHPHNKTLLAANHHLRRAQDHSAIHRLWQGHTLSEAPPVTSFQRRPRAHVALHQLRDRAHPREEPSVAKPLLRRARDHSATRRPRQGHPPSGVTPVTKPLLRRARDHSATRRPQQSHPPGEVTPVTKPLLRRARDHSATRRPRQGHPPSGVTPITKPLLRRARDHIATRRPRQGLPPSEAIPAISLRCRPRSHSAIHQLQQNPRRRVKVHIVRGRGDLLASRPPVRHNLRRKTEPMSLDVGAREDSLLGPVLAPVIVSESGDEMVCVTLRRP